MQAQVFHDEATGITLSLWRTPSGEGRMRLSGDAISFGNRDYQFDHDGRLIGTGTSVTEHRPNKLRLVN